MYIKEIEIDNFKSFANKVTVPLLEGFTAISGPNGSGKSNIIDSILFALSLSSARALRSEQGVADLITNHNKRGEASVKVTFFDEKTNDEFSIKRYVKKSKNGVKSNYYYNDKPCSVTQMHLELEKYNITPDSYNVMMQGDVTEITKCSPVERRKIIDEIAGTADFERKISLAEVQIQNVEDRVANTNILMNEIDNRIEELKSQREVALKYKKFKDEKTELENQIQGARYFETVRALELVHQNILIATKQKTELKNKLKEDESRINDLKIKYDEINSKVKAQGEEKQLEVKKQAEEIKGQIERKNSSCALNKKTIVDNLKSIENHKNGIENFKKKIEEFKAAIEEKDKELVTLNNNLNIKKEELNKILLEMTGLNKSAQEHIENRNKLKKELEGLKEQENLILKEQYPKEAQYNSNEEKIKSANETIKKFLEASKNFESTKDKLSLQIETLEKEIADCKLIQTKTFEEHDNTKSKREDVLFKLNQAQTRIAVLDTQKNAYKSFGSGGVDTVMRSNINGVIDTIARLADVEEEYKDALSVAMGGKANFIVVDTQDTAYKAIQILRAQGRDRASFIPLDIIKKAPSRMVLPKEKGVIDFAINLVDFDDEYLDAFYFALGDTVVVEDPATAKKLAGKYRVVTLDGDITEKSGSITGGAKRKTNTLFDKTQEKELDKYKKLLEKLKVEEKELSDKQKTLEGRLEEIRRQYSDSMTALNGAKIELKNLISNNEQSETIVKNGQEEIKKLKEANKKLSKELDDIENKHINLEDEIQNVSVKLEEVEKLIDEGELNKLKEKTSGVEEEIKVIENSIRETENNKQKDENQINFQESLISTREGDIKKLSADNDNLEKENEVFVKDAEQLTKKLDELEKEIEELGKNLKEFQQKREEIQEELLNAKSSKNKTNDDLERLAEQEESYKARRKELEPELERIVEEFKNAGINPKELEKTDIPLDEIKSKISKLQKKMEDLEPVNMRALTEYDEVMQRQNTYKEKVLTLENEKNEIKTRMNGYQNLKKETFLEAYNAINENFKDVFAKLSEGEGTLVLENPENPFEGGLTFRANIRDKKNQKLVGMSGGEKSLTALALVFAIQKYLPSPFYAFDEVDMHLDGPNVEKLASIITNQSKSAQFIVVSLRKPMLDKADRMIGVTQKDKGVTKISGVKLKDE